MIIVHLEHFASFNFYDSTEYIKWNLIINKYLFYSKIEKHIVRTSEIK